jgi:plasmid stabilization system protein ParE
MKVILSDAAVESLVEIGRIIQRDSPKRAITFVAELEKKCMALGFMPYAYPLLQHHENIDIRRYVYRDYLILYRVHGECVEVLNVIHGAQDYMHWIFGEE